MELEQVTNEFSQLSLDNLATRPAKPGSLGQPIKVLVNTYGIKFNNPDATIFHYDVSIKSHRPTPGPGAQPSPTAEEIKGPKLGRIIWRQVPTSHPSLVPAFQSAGFDGLKMAWSVVPFPASPSSYVVTIPPGTDSVSERYRDYKITFTPVGSLPLQTLIDYVERTGTAAALGNVAARAIQSVDVVLRHGPSMQEGIIVAGQGKKFFDPSARGIDIGQAAVVLSGFFRSARPTITGLQLNLDVVNSPYLATGNLLSVCNAIVGRSNSGPTSAGGRGGRGGGRGGRGGMTGGRGGGASGAFTDVEIRELKKRLRGTKVRVTHRPDPRHFIIEDFAKPSGQQTFELRKKDAPRPQAPSAVSVARAASSGVQVNIDQPPAAVEQVTVASYFKKHVVPGNSIPITKMTALQTSAMIKETARKPTDRLLEINKLRQSSGFATNTLLRAWGIEIAKEMTEVDARVMPAPQVQYHASSKNPKPAVSSGGWNLTNSKFTTPNVKPLEDWAVIVFGDPQRVPKAQVEDFVVELVRTAGTLGMRVKNPRPDITYARHDSQIRDLSAACRSVKFKGPPQLILLVFVDRFSYDAVKRHLMYNQLGLGVPIASQGVMAEKAFKQQRRDQYCRNLLMKINAKLGGSNWTIAAADLPKFTPKTIMLGADVTHPPPIRGRGDVDLPSSIAAVVSTQASGTLGCRAQVREQEGRKESITDFQEMTTNLMKAWIKDSKGVKPDSVLVFRDGVSEGELNRVIYHEVDAIKKSFQDVDPSGAWRPKINYVVCAKRFVVLTKISSSSNSRARHRHHIRAFAKDPTKQVDKNGNLTPGTMIDTTVVHPYLFDFYLQAHAGLVGTAKTTRYICVLNESNFTSNDVEQLVNSLSYGFQRATRSVSMVPVAYYAHVVCEKARSFVYDDDASTVSSGGTGNRRAPNFLQTQMDRKYGNYSLSPEWYM
ncbi:eukaryotic translation initiation factor 2C, partial [Phenoliferia sp. Uapishka_3]